MLHKVKRYFRNVFNSDKERHSLQNLAQTIGAFYLEKNAGDYKEATDEIIQLGVTKLDFHGSKVSISLTRPGLLIGRRGENIDKLKEYLSKQLKQKINIAIIEDVITGWLIPYEPYSDADIDSALFGEL